MTDLLWSGEKLWSRERKRNGFQKSCFLRKSSPKVPWTCVIFFCCLDVSRYVGGWIRMLQQDRLQTEMKTLTNNSVSLVELIPETLLKLLGKELPLREYSKFLTSQETKPPFLKMRLGFQLGPLWKASWCVLGSGYLCIVCTNITLPHLLFTEKGNFSGSCFYEYWTSWVRKAEENFIAESHQSVFFLRGTSLWVTFSRSATDRWHFLSQLWIDWHWAFLLYCYVSRWENEKSLTEAFSSIFLS